MLEFEFKVGFPVDQTPIRMIFWVGLKLSNIGPNLNAHRKALEMVYS